MTRDELQTRLADTQKVLGEQQRELHIGRQTVRDMEARCNQLAGAIAVLNELLASVPPSANAE